MEELLLKAFNVRVIGSGEGTVVFAHGFGTDQSAWQRILPYFLPYHRVVLYDLVCAGSVNPDFFDFQRYSTLDGYVDDLLAILDALRVRRCTFVGHSLSAMTGILASIRRPHLFGKLILIGASPRFINDGDYHGGFEVAEIEEAYSFMESNYVAWVQDSVPLAVGADVPEAVQEFSRTLFNMRPDITLFVGRMAFSCDLRGVLGLVKVPCHIIQTTKDSSVPTSVATYLQQHLGARTTLEILQTEGHLPHLSAPALLAPAISRAIPQYPGKKKKQGNHLSLSWEPIWGKGEGRKRKENSPASKLFSSSSSSSCCRLQNGDGEADAVESSERPGGGIGGEGAGAGARIRDGSVGVAADPALLCPGVPNRAVRPGLRRHRQPRLLRLPALLLAPRLRGRPPRHPRRAPHRSLRLRRTLLLRHDRNLGLHWPPRTLLQAHPRRRFSQVHQRRGLHRGGRGGGDGGGAVGHGVQLRGVGAGVRAAGGGRGRAGGGPGVQPDPLQHEARHHPLRLPRRLRLRPPWLPGPRRGPLPRHPDRQRRLRPLLGPGLPPAPPRRPLHRRDPRHRGPPPPPQRPGPPRRRHPPRARRPVKHMLGTVLSLGN